MTTPLGKDPMSHLRDALAAYPQKAAEAARQAQELAAQAVVGRSPDELVEVVLTGAGRVTDVRILAPRRDLDSVYLGEAVRDAANAALRALGELRAEMEPAEGSPQGQLREAEQRFESQVDALLASLDRLSSSLEAQLDDITDALPKNPHPGA